MPTSFDFSTLAVVPSALGPLQALIAILPHLLVILGTALVAVLKPTTYRSIAKYCWAHKGLMVLLCLPIILFFFSGRLFGAKAVEEQRGTAWMSFRGGPERTGSVAGARGPFENARVLWNYIPSATGAVQAIDSSPTVIGNRVYFGASRQTPVSKSGTITCLDTANGAVVWQYAGEGMDKPLQPVFCSPAIGGAKDDARYLVSGEGYHVDQDSRIFCLDLEPVRNSGGKLPPNLKWSLQTTSHVESSPCIFENKAYVGTGDDGWWCIDLETGKVKWRVEGVASYIITEGAQVEALAKLAGRSVAVNGSPTRYRPEEGKDFSIMFLDAVSFSEVPAGTTLVPEPARPTSSANVRTVIGKVVVTDTATNPAQKGSRVKIEMEKFYPDAECPPVALRIDGQPRLICGSGMDGQSVICMDAETGAEIWRARTSDPVFSAPSVVNGQVLVGLSNGTYVASSANPAGAVLALSAADGKELWQYKTADGVLGAVAVRDGKAYACSRDGSVYVLDAKAGTLIRKFDTGATMVCSPAVTDLGVYVSTEGGKVFGIKRDTASFQWSLNLTPSQGILSSPCATGDRLFIGSATRGLFCLVEESGAKAVHKTAAPWSGNGGNAARSNAADDRGPPAVVGNRSDRIDEPGKISAQAIEGPLTACGSNIYFAAKDSSGNLLLACVDASKRTDVWQTALKAPALAVAASETNVYVVSEANGSQLSAYDSKTGKAAWTRTLGSVSQPILCITGNQIFVKKSNEELLAIDASASKDLWSSNIGELAGDPVFQHGLLLVAIKSPLSQLLCLDDSSGTKLWSVDLETTPLGGASMLGSKIVLAQQSPIGAKIVCRSITDGHVLWETDVEKMPVSPLALSAEHVAFTVTDGTVLVLDAVKGVQTHTVLLGKGGQAPVLFQNMLFMGAENRVGAYGLTDSTWAWAYREQKTTGRVWAAPILCNETVWVSTEKLGLIAIGGKDEKK